MENIIDWVVSDEYKGTRLDVAINENFEEISRSQALAMIKSGDITLNGKTVKPGTKLKGQEIIKLHIIEQEPITNIDATPLDFPIVFEDDHIIVINKPSGLVVHPGAGREKVTVVSALLSYTKLSSIGAPIRPGIVQRLDKGTSGLMILAKTDKAHRKLAEDFATHNIEKAYTALIQGHIVNKKGKIEVAIARDRVQRKRMQATPAKEGRMAVSHFEVIEYLRGATIVHVEITTGRTHQIRVHMAFAKHPLLGDTLYGAKKLNGKTEHCLHSTKLGINHPITGEKLLWELPIPSRFQQIIEELREG